MKTLLKLNERIKLIVGMIKAKAAKSTLFVSGMTGAVISSGSKKYEFTDMHSEASRPA